MKNSFIVLLSFVIILSCDSDFKTGSFKGIIFTDSYGNGTGSMEDDGDWSFQDDVKEKVSSLFEGGFSTESSLIKDVKFSLDTLGHISYTSIFGYPNPTMGDFNVYFSNHRAGNVLVQFVIVDKDYEEKLKYENSFNGKGGFAFTIITEDLDILMDELNRVYYKITIDQNEVLYGHGDFIYTNDPQYGF
jgi:hypothetical protein